MTLVTSLRDETRILLNNRPASLTLDEIATELNVSVQWLRLLSKGKIANPGVNTVETLNKFLTKNKKKAQG